MGEREEGAATFSASLASLGLDWRATMGEVRKAYRRLSLEHHPDRVRDPALKLEAHRRFLKLRDAYEFLRRHPGLLRGGAEAAGPATPVKGMPVEAEFEAFVQRYRRLHAVHPSPLADRLTGWLEGSEGSFESIAASIIVWTLYIALVAALLFRPSGRKEEPPARSSRAGGSFEACVSSQSLTTLAAFGPLSV
ncbi:MAG: hypothetical protein A2V88_01180 [Elusimicrobia bacterium RBG_16_66_12]|nr:MAG: hypothetical protein A2V88_01180 [Elusimicrobia bacterium RBG_16_66_12]